MCIRDRVKFGKYHKPQKGNYSTAARIYKGYLYYSSELTVYRVKLDENLVPEGMAEIIVDDDHEHGSHEHIGKPIAFDEEGHIFVPLAHPIMPAKILKGRLLFQAKTPALF